MLALSTKLKSVSGMTVVLFEKQNENPIRVFVIFFSPTYYLNGFNILSLGNPKGAMLTHENVVANAAGVLKGFEVRNLTDWFFLKKNVVY